MSWDTIHSTRRQLGHDGSTSCDAWALYGSGQRIHRHEHQIKLLPGGFDPTVHSQVPSPNSYKGSWDKDSPPPPQQGEAANRRTCTCIIAIIEDVTRTAVQRPAVSELAQVSPPYGNTPSRAVRCETVVSIISSAAVQTVFCAPSVIIQLAGLSRRLL